MIRMATPEDVPQILAIRKAMVENPLRNPLDEKKMKRAIVRHCRAWVAFEAQVCVGFSLANRANYSVWGLFVLQEFQRRGWGKCLLNEALEWLSLQKKPFWHLSQRVIWLETQIGSSSEKFYQYLGWVRGKELVNGHVLYWWPGEPKNEFE